jgi:hypothetical protein
LWHSFALLWCSLSFTLFGAEHSNANFCCLFAL